MNTLEIDSLSFLLFFHGRDAPLPVGPGGLLGDVVAEHFPRGLDAGLQSEEGGPVDVLQSDAAAVEALVEAGGGLGEAATVGHHVEKARVGDAVGAASHLERGENVRS